MTKTKTRGRQVKNEIPEAKSQMSFSTRTAHLNLAEDTPMVEPSDTGSFVSINHDGLPGMMTPISFSGPSLAGAAVNGGDMFMGMSEQSPEGRQ